jgi:hypothetical protein
MLLTMHPLLALAVVASTPATKLDFTKPADNIEAWAKLEADTSGKTIYRVSRMTAYGVPQTGYTVPLFAMRSITKIEYRKIVGGYDSRWVACGVYVGADNNDVLTRYRNPFTGQFVELKPLCSKITGARYTAAKGLEMTASFPLESSIIGRPYVLNWEVLGDKAVVQRVAHSKWTEPGTQKVKYELSIDSYSARLEDLQNPALTSVDGAFSYTLITEWLSSMKMGKRPGNILWKSVGRKVSNESELPADVIADLERAAPGKLAAPLKW